MVLDPGFFVLILRLSCFHLEDVVWTAEAQENHAASHSITVGEKYINLNVGGFCIISDLTTI